MKLSQYAKLKGVSYLTAKKWFHAGDIKGVQMPSGTIVIDELIPEKLVDPNIIKVSHQGKITIGDFKLPCYVLENGLRVLSGRGMQASLSINNTGGQKMVSFITKSSLKPFIDAEIIAAINTPMQFANKQGKIGYGFEAKILNKICSNLLSYRRHCLQNNMAISDSENRIISQCEILQGGFAEVGIIALVDEATGYQGDRQKDELQKILSAYISKELLPWQKRFPNEYYEQICRLRDWNYDPLTQKRPQIIGKITNQIVYKLLPDGILEELRKLNPPNENGNRSQNHHQFLTLDIGNINLERHLAQVIVLMRICKSWVEFEEKLYDAFPRFGQQEKLF